MGCSQMQCFHVASLETCCKSKHLANCVGKVWPSQELIPLNFLSFFYLNCLYPYSCFPRNAPTLPPPQTPHCVLVLAKRGAVTSLPLPRRLHVRALCVQRGLVSMCPAAGGRRVTGRPGSGARRVVRGMSSKRSEVSRCVAREDQDSGGRQGVGAGCLGTAGEGD